MNVSWYPLPRPSALDILSNHPVYAAHLKHPFAKVARAIYPLFSVDHSIDLEYLAVDPSCERDVQAAWYRGWVPLVVERLL